MKWLAAAFGLFLVAINVAADAGRLREWLPGVYTTPGLDKVGHFTLVGGLAFLLNRAAPGRVMLWSVGLFAVVSLEEASQLFLPARSFDLGDLACDAIGIATAAWFAHKLSPSKSAA